VFLVDSGILALDNGVRRRRLIFDVDADEGGSTNADHRTSTEGGDINDLFLPLSTEDHRDFYERLLFDRHRSFGPKTSKKSELDVPE